MKSLYTDKPWMFVVGLLLVFFAFNGCDDDRNVLDTKARYACSSQSECLEGFQCAQGWCTPISALTDAHSDGLSSPEDGGRTDDTDSTTDLGSPSDSTPGGVQDASTAAADSSGDCAQGKPTKPCGTITWQGCPCGQGCYYYDDATKDPVCKGHGNKGLNDPCDPKTGLTSCGKHDGKPLLCDGLDKKCYLLCDTTKSAQCPPAHKCFGLEDPNKVKWPNNTGICAP